MTNKKIEQFVEQCRQTNFHLAVDGPEDYESFDYEKFAQLVAKDCVDLVRLQYVGEYIKGSEYRNRGLEAAEFIICMEYGIEKRNQPVEKF